MKDPIRPFENLRAALSNIEGRLKPDATSPDATYGLRLEKTIGIVLRIGVMASTVCLSLGLVLSVVGGASPLATTLLHTGVIVLLVTPVARVVVSVGEYAIERDWLFLALTLTVLVELLASVVAAMYGRHL